VSFGSLSALVIEIGGDVPGREFDRVTIADRATLAGKLAVTTIDGFSPDLPGQSFEILTAGSLAGSFDQLVGRPSATHRGLFWTVNYTATTVTLSTSALPGDIDLDGEVDRTDAATFSKYFGRESDSIWTTGDFDGDGRTSLTDWGLLQSHLGQSAASPSVAAVPEPATWLIVLVLVGMRSVGFRRNPSQTAHGP
jgi:hypothetical protein